MRLPTRSGRWIRLVAACCGLLSGVGCVDETLIKQVLSENIALTVANLVDLAILNLAGTALGTV